MKTRFGTILQIIHRRLRSHDTCSDSADCEEFAYVFEQGVREIVREEIKIAMDPDFEEVV